MSRAGVSPDRGRTWSAGRDGARLAGAAIAGSSRGPRWCRRSTRSVARLAHAGCGSTSRRRRGSLLSRSVWWTVLRASLPASERAAEAPREWVASLAAAATARRRVARASIDRRGERSPARAKRSQRATHDSTALDPGSRHCRRFRPLAGSEDPLVVWSFVSPITTFDGAVITIQRVRQHLLRAPTPPQKLTDRVIQHTIAGQTPLTRPAHPCDRHALSGMRPITMLLLSVTGKLPADRRR